MNLKKVNQFFVNSVLDLDEISEVIIASLGHHRIILLQGDLGVGKTTLTQIICKNMGISQTMSSPTYAIINEYRVTESLDLNIDSIFHIDLYRLENLEEALSIGIEDYLENKKAISFIEWPEIIEPLIERAIIIKMAHNANGSRQIDVYLYE